MLVFKGLLLIQLVY